VCDDNNLTSTVPADLSSGCVTLKDVQDQGQVPIMVMEAKSLEDFQDLATIQLMTQAIAICRAAWGFSISSSDY
jgi:hypothetical protein